MTLQTSWLPNEKLFLFEYHAIPNFDTEILGAYINCWIISEGFNDAKFRSQHLIEKECWEVENIEDISEIEKGSIQATDENFQYYEQVVTDKEVLVFYTYDTIEEEF